MSFDTALGMAVQNGLECFSDIGGWIDAVELARRHDRREERPGGGRVTASVWVACIVS